MVDYKELYFHLFGVMADAVEELEKPKQENFNFPTGFS